MLVGIHVVSLAVNLPGPLAAARLSELGASVTKIEPPAGDPLAAAAPGWYSKLVRAQQVAFLDLKDPHGRAKLDIELTGADLAHHRYASLGAMQARTHRRAHHISRTLTRRDRRLRRRA